MPTAKRIIKNIRRIPKPSTRKHLREKKIAEWQFKKLQEEKWERDKKIVRTQNFKKARIAREQQVEAINAEKDRQEQIANNRLKNLKKARRKWKILRKTPTT